MKKQIFLILVSSILFMLSMASFASTTGGSFGNLIPAPKNTAGTIQAGRYYRAVADTAYQFSIAIPQYADAYEYRYMQIKEERDPTYTYVSFGPAAMDDSIYRIVIKKTTSSDPFSIRKYTSLNFFATYTRRWYDATYTVVAKGPIHFKGYNGMMGLAQVSTANFSFIQVIYVIDHPTLTIVLVADLYPIGDTTINGIKRSLLHRNNSGWNRFVNSFNLRVTKPN